MASHTLKAVDDALWASFKARCQAEGRSIKWVLLELIRRYVAEGWK